MALFGLRLDPAGVTARKAWKGTELSSMGAVFLAPGFGRPRTAVPELASVFQRPVCAVCVEECSHSSPSQSLSEFGCTQKATVKKSRLDGRTRQEITTTKQMLAHGLWQVSPKFKASAKDWFPVHCQEGA